MDTGPQKKDELPDIFPAPPGESDQQKDVHLLSEEIERHLHRTRLLNILIGILVFILILIVAGTIFYCCFNKPKPAPPLPEPKVKEAFFQPGRLSDDEVWVLSFRNEAEQIIRGLNSDKKPLSAQWVKAAAYNLIVGEQALTAGNYTNAATHLEKALIIFPEMESVHEMLGITYLHLKQWDSAIAQLEEAVQHHETFGNISNLGIALLGADRLDEAEDVFLEAEALRPDHPGIHKNLAILYHKAGQHEKALQHFDTYFSSCPSDPEAVEVFVHYLSDRGMRPRAIDFLNDQILKNSESRQRLYLILARLEAEEMDALATVEALENAFKFMTAPAALVYTHQKVFDGIRETTSFRNLVIRLELATVTMEE